MAKYRQPLDVEKEVLTTQFPTEGFLDKMAIEASTAIAPSCQAGVLSMFSGVKSDGLFNSTLLNGQIIDHWNSTRS